MHWMCCSIRKGHPISMLLEIYHQGKDNLRTISCSFIGEKGNLNVISVTWLSIGMAGPGSMAVKYQK